MKFRTDTWDLDREPANSGFQLPFLSVAIRGEEGARTLAVANPVVDGPPELISSRLGHDDVQAENQNPSVSKWARAPLAESTDPTCSECRAGLIGKASETGGFKVGDVVDDYQVDSVLGVGGMGEVYKVRNLISGRMEAMKVLLETNIQSINRFLREIKVQAALDHPNIATLHTARRVENQILMIMECVEGMTIEKLLEGGRLPLADSVGCVCQVLAALSYTHSLGIIHRDVKPANIMVTPHGTVKLMDFGIARLAAERHLTQTGMLVGSLPYMSPEQIQGVGNLDARSDLYSVGMVLYEIVTGRRPFKGEGDYSIILAHLQQNPVPPIEFDPKIPMDLNNIILKSISKNPTERFQSADAFRAALKTLALPETSVSPAATSKTGPTTVPQATATDGHRISKTDCKARQRLPRSLYIAVSAVFALAVLALAVAVGQSLLRRLGGGHVRAETAVPVDIQALTPLVSSVNTQPGQSEQLIPQAQAGADAESDVLLAKPGSRTTVTRPRQSKVPSQSPQPATALQGTTTSSENPDKLKRFVPPPDLAEPLPFQAFDPPNILSIASITDVNLGLLEVASTPSTAKARHVHFLGRCAAGLFTILGQHYRFQEEHSSHVFEGFRGDLKVDCKPGNAICQIRITRLGHQEVIRLKTSDWVALQMNLEHP